MTKVMECEIWSGGWGLPSIDQKCLEIMAYAKFAGAPLKLIKTDNPLNAFFELPVFRHGDTCLHSSDDVVTHFRKEGYNADYSADVRSCDVRAYEALVRTRLPPGVLHTWFLDDRNYADVIRPMYAKKLRFPLNYFYPGHYQRSAKERLWMTYTLKGETPSEQELAWRIIERDAFKMAVECLNVLSTKLGDKDFFTGQSPKFFDAVVFSYLAPLLKIPLPKSNLQAHLKASPNLVAFVERILHRYFQPSPLDEAPVVGTPAASGTKSQGGSDDDDAGRLKNFLVSLGAVIAMGIYAVYAGHVYVNVKRKHVASLESLESAVEDFYEPSEDGDQT